MSFDLDQGMYKTATARKEGDRENKKKPCNFVLALKNTKKGEMMAKQRFFSGLEPRDLTRDLISAPLVTTFSLKALIDSPQFQQKIVLPSGRTVSYTTCGSKTGIPVLYFYGLGGSSRQIASMHAQAVRLDIKLISIDRPGTGFTEPYKSPSQKSRWRKKGDRKTTKQRDNKVVAIEIDDSDNDNDADSGVVEDMIESDDKKSHQHHHHRHSHHNHRHYRDLYSGGENLKEINRKKTFCTSSSSSQQGNINQRVTHTCVEAMAVLDQLLPGARFGMMGHSCGIYYIMRMLQLFPDRIQEGPISLLTPWVPFNECPETTSRSFRFLKHVPRGLVWAVTSSMNHLGSVILSSTQAFSGTLSNKSPLDDSEADKNKNKSKDKDKDRSSKTTTTTGKSRRKRKNHTCKDHPDPVIDRRQPADPFVLQFSDAFDKILLPALVQDMNRQHSNGYNSEIQMCISDVGFDFADVTLPEGVTVNAYCGHLDNMVPIEASREMGRKCGWDMHEFKYSGHGGPRICMYAMEDYAMAVHAIEAAKVVQEQWSEKYADY
ncbi:hypothetical protein BGX28_006075 [Mortierella sp. GBA30]|nr:hypothetical protein BGX28_006075 [Mortierella sp. GBA30]